MSFLLFFVLSSSGPSTATASPEALRLRQHGDRAADSNEGKMDGTCIYMMVYRQYMDVFVYVL